MKGHIMEVVTANEVFKNTSFRSHYLNKQINKNNVVWHSQDFFFQSSLIEVFRRTLYSYLNFILYAYSLISYFPLLYSITLFIRVPYFDRVRKTIQR